MPKTVIWDFNGTVLDDLILCLNILNQMLARRGLPPVSREAYLDRFDFPVIDYYQAVGFDFTHEPYAGLAQEYMAQYQPASFDCPLRRQVEETLAAIRARGIQQVLLSATKRDFLQQQTDYFGLTGCFDQIIGLDDILGRSKMVMARHWFGSQDLAIGDVVLIGDTTHDFAVAQDLGCRCLLLEGGHNSRQRLEATGSPVYGGPADILRILLNNRLF
jgi:phosphoglycolate phosphatase